LKNTAAGYGIIASLTEELLQIRISATAAHNDLGTRINTNYNLLLMYGWPLRKYDLIPSLRSEILLQQLG